MKSFKIILVAIFSIAFVNFSVHGQSKNKAITPGYAEVSYNGMTDNEFLKNWLILGPVKFADTLTKPTEAKQKEFFDNDPVTNILVSSNKAISNVKIGNKEYTWKSVRSDEGTVDLIKLFGQIDYAVAYAVAEIKMEAPARVLVGLGSDDGVKLFLNGTLVHHNWIGRGTTPDDDILFLDLKKGSNQILLKVQNMEYGWSFTLRKLGKDLLGKKLSESSGKGNLDNVKLLIENGADVNTPDDLGLTPYQNASIKGREKIMEILKSKGAKTDAPIPPFDNLVNQLFKKDLIGIAPGAAVLVSQDGKIIYENCFGYSDVGNKVPVTLETKFRIGSITKQFVACAILKLQEEGKVNVQDKLSKFIPDFPRGDEVTIHQLLTHTSGIHSYTNNETFVKYVTLPVTSKSLVDSIKRRSFDFNPGDKYQYNNAGFFLLGYLVEQISGKSLNDFLKETFFKPLGMNNTGVYQTSEILDNEAYGYAYDNNVLKKALNWDMSWAGGAGAIYSTVKDLYTWNEAIFNGKVLSEQSLKAAFTPAVLNNKEKVDYGYGWGFQEMRGLKIIGHSGGLHGFLSDLKRLPDNKVTVVILCNSTPTTDGVSPSLNALSIVEYLLWPSMSKQSSFASDISIDENTLKSYVGRYDYGQGAVLIVTLDGKQLYGQMTGQSKFPIFPSSKDEFNWKVVEARIKFITDDKGVVTGAIHYQNGQQINVKRLNDETPITVNPAIFDKYVGEYDLGNQYKVVITKDGDKLMAQGPNLPKYQLLAASETEYFVKEMSVRVIFKLNAEGKTESVVLRINGNDQTAKKIL